MYAAYLDIETKDPNGEVSPIELRLLNVLYNLGVQPECQYRIGRRRVDFAFPRYQVAVEADGWEFHQDVHKERRRDAEIEALGWIIWHYSGGRISEDSQGCALDIIQRLACLEPVA